MSESSIAFAIFVPAALLAMTHYCLDRVRRREALYRWANANGYRLLRFRQPVLTEASPFPLALSKAQHVFHIEVEGRRCQRQSGWIRLGAAWRGLASNKAEVRWDKER